MSQANVEIVRAVLAEFATTRRAESRHLTSDFVWEMGTYTGWLDTPTYFGAEGFDEFFGQWTAPYDDWEIDVPDIRDVGDDRVVALVTQRGQPQGSDSWVQLRYGMVYTLQGGLVSRIEAFATWDEALAAVGPSE